jgi:hypothetical protein
LPFLRRKSGEPRDYQREMIDETSRWLSWALSERRDLPRIPTRMSDHGGFSALMKMTGARKLVAHWWGRVLDKLPDR